MKYLIIEDEPLAQKEMSRLISIVDSEAHIIGVTDSVTASVNWLSDNPAPDLIFMDIHLSDNLCFEIFNRIKVTSPVIFTTAYDQYAIRAFQTNGIGYLLKPIDEEQLRTAITKYRELSSSANNMILASLQNIADQLHATAPYKERILAKLGDNYHHIPIVHTAYFYSEDHYTFLVTVSGQKYIINHTLDYLETQIDPLRFFRISRQCIVNIEAITFTSKHFNGRLKIYLNPPYHEELYVARSRVNTFLEWLDK